MRMYGFLKNPSAANQQELVYKVMLHETRRQGTFAYLYTSPEALFCSYDYHYSSLEDALEDWEGDVERWVELGDPLPVRIKGRDQGAPQWGRYEILENGEWKDFTP